MGTLTQNPQTGVWTDSSGSSEGLSALPGNYNPQTGQLAPGATVGSFAPVPSPQTNSIPGGGYSQFALNIAALYRKLNSASASARNDIAGNLQNVTNTSIQQQPGYNPQVTPQGNLQMQEGFQSSFQPMIGSLNNELSNIGTTTANINSSIEGLNKAIGPESYKVLAPTDTLVTGQGVPLAGIGVDGNTLAGTGGKVANYQLGQDLQVQTDAYNKVNALIYGDSSKGLVGLQQRIEQDPSFNVSPLVLANQLTKWINTGVYADPKYTNIINSLQEIATTIGPVLGTPGNPTDLKTTIADSIVPRLMAGQDIMTVLKGLENNAQLKLNAGHTTATGVPFTQTTAPNAPGTVYIVQQGDDLSKIAQSHGMKVTDLEKLNPQFGGNYSLIKPGEKIYLSSNSNNTGGGNKYGGLL